MIRLWDDSLPLARIASAIKDCGWIDLDNVPLMVANTLSSSWDRLFAGTSKLAVENLCHSAKDIGLWGIFFMSDPLKYEICCFDLQDQDAVVHDAAGGSTPICEDIGRLILCDNRRIPLHELEAPTPKAGAGP
ncbi:hypothetical protein quinque_009645 [Culex quinquefasciatus]